MSKPNVTCTCCQCTKKRPLHFHVSVDPVLYPSEYEILLIARRQRDFNKLFRQFLREYAISVANQLKPSTSTHS
jgi:hypothetical protein